MVERIWYDEQKEFVCNTKEIGKDLVRGGDRMNLMSMQHVIKNLTILI